jgi:hypothetical protein
MTLIVLLFFFFCFVISGGGVIGASGRNAAEAVLRDKKLALRI